MGTSQSFTSIMFSLLNKLDMEPLLESLGVVLLTGEVVVCFKVTECQLVLYSYILKVYFVVFNLLGLDIILEMD